MALTHGSRLRSASRRAFCFFEPGRQGQGKQGQSYSEGTFGKVDGKPVDLYTLTNAKGAVAKITNYGAIVTELHVPDRNGKLGDVVLGFDNVDDYVEEEPVLRRHRRAGSPTGSRTRRSSSTARRTS